MTPLLLPLLLQVLAPALTVGDTVWLSRSVTLPPGAEVRPAAWELDGAVMLLGRPRVELNQGRATVRYPAVAWTAGTHTVDVPGPIVVMADGRTDSLPAQPVSFTVESVLPSGRPAGELPIRAETGLLRETVTTPVPVLALLGAVTLLFVPLAWWWWRRRRPVTATAGVPGASAVPVEVWAEDGELRAVAAATAQQVRESLVAALPGAQPGRVTARLLSQAEARRPALPVEELTEVLKLLESAAYAPEGVTDMAALASRASRLRDRLKAADA